ncbi:MAG: plasmid pRiA4b ORF-3 family protein [Alphaproteobacteria bacterium]
MRLRISLIGIEPEVWRRVEVPLDISVMHVHDVIQAVMGWHGSHLFEFHAGKKYYGIPDPDDIDFGRRVINAATARFRTLLASGGCEIGYVYDFGDYWEHRLAVEAIEPACPDRLYPRLLDGARRSPPEDVGGAHGYHEFLDAMTRPGHRMHRRMIEWYCGRYDPDDIDLSAIHRRLDKIARHGAARKAAKREREV